MDQLDSAQARFRSWRARLSVAAEVFFDPAIPGGQVQAHAETVLSDAISELDEVCSALDSAIRDVLRKPGGAHG
jgi:hypothetical protein